MERGSGILLHITSLPNKFGLGCLSKEAYEFIDFLSEAKCKYWQTLPVNPVYYGDCPYSCYSSFSINTALIDLSEYLTEDELRKIGFSEKTKNKYDELQNKYDVALKLIYKKFKDITDISEFVNNNTWVYEHALYTAIKKKYNNTWFFDFPKGLKERNPKAIEEFKKNNTNDINTQIFAQYIIFPFLSCFVL